MKKIRNLIVLVFIIILVICIILINVINKKNVTNEELEKQQNEYIYSLENPASTVNGKKPELVYIANIYYTIENIVKQYMTCINEEKIQELSNILDEEYILDNKITKENMLSKLDKYVNIEKYKTDDMYSLNGSNYMQYYVKGNINNKNIFLNVNTDFSNKTFSVIPMKEEEYTAVLNTIVEGKTGQEKQISPNEYNKVTYQNISTEQMAENLLQDYVVNALYYPEDAYNSLDEDYREKRFGSIEKFKEYVNDNKETLKKIDKSNIKSYSEFNNEEDYTKYLEQLDRVYLDKYSTESTENGIQYICVDDYDNYYIFNTTAVMKYSLTLDTHTIESDKFKTEYNNGSDQKKVQLNIDKFIKMLNNKDYSNAYAVLDEGFKNNYFKSEEDFKKYIKNNFFEYNSVTYDKFSQESGVYIFQITLADKTLKNSKKIKVNIIMQLKEGTDFVMSFGGAS